MRLSARAYLVRTRFLRCLSHRRLMAFRRFFVLYFKASSCTARIPGGGYSKFPTTWLTPNSRAGVETPRLTKLTTRLLVLSFFLLLSLLFFSLSRDTRTFSIARCAAAPRRFQYRVFASALSQFPVDLVGTCLCADVFRRSSPRRPYQRDVDFAPSFRCFSPCPTDMRKREREREKCRNDVAN